MTFPTFDSVMRELQVGCFPVPTAIPPESNPLASCWARVTPQPTQKSKRVTGTLRQPLVQCTNDRKDTASGVALHGLRVSLVESDWQGGEAEAVSVVSAES